MIRIGRLKFGRLDLDGKDMTYGNRIALADIFSPSQGKTEYRQFCEAFKELHGYSARLVPLPLRVKRIYEITEGLRSWIEKEQQMLKYTPSSDEIAAGIEELGKKVGSMSTIKALAKAYGKDPDEILQWQYAKVFGILYTDLEERKFEKKYQQQINGKSRSHKYNA